MTGPVLSPVDYDAWNRGYMPPSEHVLIDKLAFRGAKVHLSTPISRLHQIWVVIEGPAMTNAQRKAVREVMNLWFEDDPDLTTQRGDMSPWFDASHPINRPNHD